MRSIPEKTLEHWVSIYLSNRFPGGALWWPTSGEDVLAELPRLAATGPGKTVSLELKTTEARGDNHVLEIDTDQLMRYLRPAFGPPLPVYYVFPVPHWTGPLTSRSGTAPAAPGGTVKAPPQWWRRQARPDWFGDWLYVMSAQSVAQALPPDWYKRYHTRAALFTIQGKRRRRGSLVWTRVFGRPVASRPLLWADFWKIVTQCGPEDGVRWRTVAGDGGRLDRLLVLDRGEENYWSLSNLLGRGTRRIDSVDRGDVEIVSGEDGGGSEERVLLHIPESALR